MKVHNLMEDVVSKLVDKLYDQAKKDKAPWLTCDCENCRIDSISYVLNRITPKYIVSDRGVTHSLEILNDKQLLADIETIALEGIKIVNSSKRPFHKEKTIKESAQRLEEPSFNFSTITGVLLDGSTFEPITGATLTLYCDGIKSEMIDHTFHNPYKLVRQTKGTYCFWMKSLPAEKAGIIQTFQMKIEVEAPGYTPVVHHFEVTLKSDECVHSELDSNYSIKLKDLVLFKDDIVNDMDF